MYSSLQLLYNLTLPVRHRIGSIIRSRIGTEYINLRETMPETKEVYKLAEYHNLKLQDERGIDFKGVKDTLIANGFMEVVPNYHWGGKSISQVFLDKRIYLRLEELLTGYPRERFMENIQIIARKEE